MNLSARKISVHAFLLIILLVTFSSFSQITSVEVLRRNLAAAENDTARVDLLNMLGFHYSGISSKKALEYLNESLDISLRNNYRKGLAYCYLYIGRVHFYDDEYQSAYTSYYKSYPVLKELDDLQGLSEYHFFLGELDRLLGDYDQSIKNYQQAIALKEVKGDYRGISICLNSIGKVHFDQRNFQLALDYFTQSLVIKEELSDKSGIGTVLTNIAELYETTGEKELAVEYYTKGLQIRIEVGEVRRIAISRYLMGKMYCKFGDFESARSNFEEALKTFQKMMDQTGVAMVLISYAELLGKAGSKDHALDYVQEALTITERIGNKNLSRDGYKVLSEIYSEIGEYHLSLDAYRVYNHLSDSLFSIENEKIIADLEAKYRSAKKDQQILHLDDENKLQKQKLTILSISVIALVLASLLLISIFRFRTINLRQKTVIMERERLLKIREAEAMEKEHRIMVDKLEQQNKDLISKALLINKISQTNQSIADDLKKLSLKISERSRGQKLELDKIIRDLKHYSNENLWGDFEMAFGRVHASFYSELLRICPELSPSEIRIAALLRLNLSTKEMEALTFKSESGIKSIRYRLRKKLGLDSDDNLTAFLIRL